jgi:hypothetical protein
MPTPSQLDASGDAIRQVIRAYHGSPSPNHFDKFDAAYIGSGEGHQSYGFGHYAAQSKDVADNYRRNLSHRKLKDDFLDMLDPQAGADEVQEMLPHFDPKQQNFLNELNNNDWLGFDYPSQAISASMKNDAPTRWDMSPELISAKNNLGTAYELAIDAPEKQLLDWDAPLHNQHAGSKEIIERLAPLLAPKNRDNLRELVRYGDEVPGQALWYNLSDAYKEPMRGLGIGANYSEAARVLKDAGVPGVRYLDAGSRSVGDGTRNYVMFPGTEDQIRILRKYGLMAPVAAGAAASGASEQPAP